MRFFITLIISISLSVPALADKHHHKKNDKINYHALEKEGFGNVADILKDMTPEQREEVLRQAKELEKELQTYSPEEREMLTDSLRSLDGAIPQHGVEAKRLDPHKFKGLKGTKEDIKQYQRQYKK
jgi:hypothetical protein